jgi:hypothetical protein
VHLFLQLVRALKATENLEALLLGERDRNLLVGCESEVEFRAARMPSGEG